MNGLAGRTVVVTRPRDQAGPLASALRRTGAEVVLLPTIDVRAADDPGPLDRALRDLGIYAWVVFTSANAVRFVDARMQAVGVGAFPAGLRVAAVGRATAAALEERGLPVHAVPKTFVGSRIPDVLGDVAGARVLLPRADIGREATVDAIEAAGAVVDVVTAYHTVPAAPDRAGLAALDAGVDAITFTSPSTFRNLIALLGTRARPVLEGVTIGSIGPVTSEAVRGAGFPVHVEPADHTADALCAALASYFAGRAVGAAGESI